MLTVNISVYIHSYIIWINIYCHTTSNADDKNKRIEVVSNKYQVPVIVKHSTDKREPLYGIFNMYSLNRCNKTHIYFQYRTKSISELHAYLYI